MNLKTMFKGMTAGAMVGLSYYALSSASPMKKYNIKRDAGKTLKSAERLMHDIKSIIS